jgi:hypothetical protein
MEEDGVGETVEGEEGLKEYGCKISSCRVASEYNLVRWDWGV